MITLTQAKEYINSQGIENIPDFVLSAWIEDIAEKETCLLENYSESKAILIQAYLIALFALAQADKYLSSQSAPSGASRSFKYNSFAERWKAQLTLLKSADKNQCVADLIPADPTRSATAFLAVANGGCL